jgi:gamma-glutamyltranspeptidase/glutathione hydrolase
MERGRAEFFHAFAEASKCCWQERQSALGDPDFVNVPVEELILKKSAQQRGANIKAGMIGGPAAAGDHSRHTSNVVAADREGSIISVTATQGWMYGSHLVVDGMGLVLNHGMSRFDYVPGHPNAPAAGKRMQNNMAPVIALRDGRVAFAYGLPGGPKIVTATAQLAIDTIVFGTSAAEAVAAPRLHTDGAEPLLVSEHMPADVNHGLERLGHAVRREADMGGPVNVLVVEAESGRIDIASGEITGAVAGV